MPASLWLHAAVKAAPRRRRHGPALAAAWRRHDNAMAAPWRRHGRKRHGRAFVRPWRRHGSAAQLWRCSGPDSQYSPSHATAAADGGRHGAGILDQPLLDHPLLDQPRAKRHAGVRGGGAPPECRESGARGSLGCRGVQEGAVRLASLLAGTGRPGLVDLGFDLGRLGLARSRARAAPQLGVDLVWLTWDPGRLGQTRT